MADALKHKTQSAKADLGVAGEIGPSEWNEEHTFAGGATGEVLVYDAAASDKVTWWSLLKKGADVVSATSVTLGADGNVFHVTGTTTVAGIATKAAGFLAVLIFDGILNLTHNGASFILRDAVDVRTAAGDVLVLVSEGSGNWREVARVQPVLRKGADVPSGNPLAINAGGQYYHVTGTNAIAAIVTRPAGHLIVLRFAGVLTLTHHATSLILPNNAANITTAANDAAVFVSEGGGNWRCVAYVRASGQALQTPASGSLPTFLCAPGGAAFPTADFPQLLKNSGTNWTDYTLDYDKTTEEAAFWSFAIPAGTTFTGATIEVYSRQGAVTAGTAGWKVTTLTRADGEAWDTAGVTDTVTAATVKGTAGQVLRQSQALTVTGWAAAEALLVKIARDVASDTADEDVKFVGACLRLT